MTDLDPSTNADGAGLIFLRRFLLAASRPGRGVARDNGLRFFRQDHAHRSRR